MKFSDHGIIISIKKYGENSAIIKVFSQHHGVYRAFVKSVKSSKDKTIYQIGNLITFEYRARLEDNLGQLFSVDLAKSYAAKIMFDSLRLACVNSVFSIIDAIFLEREEHQLLFVDLQNFLQNICAEDYQRRNFLADYIKLELKILETLGYGIDLSSCAVTEKAENLAFVSPKSARAVSYEVGKPYQNRLLKLPSFLLGEQNYDEKELQDGIKLSSFFLEKFVFAEKSESYKIAQLLHRDHIKKSILKN